MMKPVLRIDGSGASAVLGRPVLDPVKALWNGGMLLAAVTLAPLFFSWSALALFVSMTYGSLLVGHSVGMHRMMIHRSFACPKPLERLLVYIGVLVGVAGPFGIIKIHDTRDWTQRQSACHDFFSHSRPLLQDLVWQLAYRFEFVRPPMLNIEPNFSNDPYFRFMEATWRLHQLALALVFYLCGGWPWVIWGVCVRVIVSSAGHWTITYYCHNPGQQKWLVKGASVQASNLPGMALLSHGECWHNNHHAFPESARVGLEPGQLDPAWIVISLLQKCGLVTNVGAPRSIDQQDDLMLAPLCESAFSETANRAVR